jgi:hypothetical protein
VATLEDVAVLARELPDVVDGERHGTRTWFVAGKAFAWERSFSKADVKRFGDATPPDGPILAVHVEDLGEKEAVLAAHPEAFFTIPHFDGYAAVLIQLREVSKKALREAMVDAWLARAPAKLAAEYLRRSALTYPVDPRVDAYIDALAGWQQAICRVVRDLVHAADPEVTETIKRTNRPYFVLQGNICALLAAKDHVNVFLYDGAIVPDPEGIITGGHENQTARTVAVRPGESINAAALTAMFKQIIANNRAGGWRKLKREG